MSDCLEEVFGKTMHEDPRKPEGMSNEFIARILEGRHEATNVQFSWLNGGKLYKDILAEAAKRIRRKELEEDDQFAPHYEDDPHGYNVEVMSCRDALEQLMIQDVCVQHGFEEGNEFCSDCGGRPEKFGGAGTCPWEYARAALNATDNWDFETRKRMDLLCREIEHLRKRIKFLDENNRQLTRKWEVQLAESCRRCARLGENPQAYDTNLVVMEKKNEPDSPTA